MKIPNDGGPAFPHPETGIDVTLSDGRRAARIYPPSTGMSLRAYIATAALQGILSGNLLRSDGSESAESIASDAVEMADALICALGKEETK